ncbi:TPA: hypothetical protein ACS7XF_000117 [Providencia alcalifaciens]
MAQKERQRFTLPQTIDKPLGLEMVILGCKINKENQFIDFRLITQRGKNHDFIPLCQQPKAAINAALFIEIYLELFRSRSEKLA